MLFLPAVLATREEDYDGLISSAMLAAKWWGGGRGGREREALLVSMETRPKSSHSLSQPSTAMAGVQLLLVRVRSLRWWTCWCKTRFTAYPRGSLFLKEFCDSLCQEWFPRPLHQRMVTEITWTEEKKSHKVETTEYFGVEKENLREVTMQRENRTEPLPGFTAGTKGSFLCVLHVPDVTCQ